MRPWADKAGELERTKSEGPTHLETTLPAAPPTRTTAIRGHNVGRALLLLVEAGVVLSGNADAQPTAKRGQASPEIAAAVEAGSQGDADLCAAGPDCGAQRCSCRGRRLPLAIRAAAYRPAR
jgi:hypothetical protein